MKNIKASDVFHQGLMQNIKPQSGLMLYSIS
jgi:hypothetical protein